MAERLLYLPLVGIMACVVMVVEPHAGKYAPAVFAAIALVFAARTWVRNPDWTSDLTMPESLVRTSPNSFKAHRLLGDSLFLARAGEADLNRVIAEADKSAAILSALPAAEQDPKPYNLAAAARIAQEQFPDAAAAAERSIAIEAAGRAEYNRRHGTQIQRQPGAAHPYRLLAKAFLGMEQPLRAIAPATEALSIDAMNVEAWPLLANALLGAARPDDAAITMAQGMLVTGSQALRADLVNFYRSELEPGSCALVAGPNGPAINPNCPVVRRHLCAAAAKGNRLDYLKELRCGL